MNDSIENIKDFQKKMEDASGNTEDVRSGMSTKEEEQQEPAYLLLNGIADTSVKILQMPTVAAFFEKLSNKLGSDLTHDLIEVLTIIMSNSAYEAVVFYDELLKRELTKQFDNVGETFNKIGADVNAHNGVLSVFKARLDEIEKSLKIDKIKKDIGEN